MRNIHENKLFRSILLPVILVVIGAWVYFGSKNMPKDYFSKKIEKYGNESEKHELATFLPDSAYYNLYPEDTVSK